MYYAIYIHVHVHTIQAVTLFLQNFYYNIEIHDFKKRRSNNFTGRNGGCYTSQKIIVLVLRPEMSKHFNCKICKGQ